MAVLILPKCANDQRKIKSIIKINGTICFSIFSLDLHSELLQKKFLFFFHVKITFLFQKDLLPLPFMKQYIFIQILSNIQKGVLILEMYQLCSTALTTLNFSHCVKSPLIKKWNYKCCHHRKKSTFTFFL